MIVYQHKSVSGMSDRGFEDFAGMGQRLIQDAYGDLYFLEQSEASIDESTGKDFAIGLYQLTGEEIVNAIGRIERILSNLITTKRGEAKSAEEAHSFFAVEERQELNKRSARKSG
jgi:hypothetical protein